MKIDTSLKSKELVEVLKGLDVDLKAIVKQVNPDKSLSQLKKSELVEVAGLAQAELSSSQGDPAPSETATVPCDDCQSECEDTCLNEAAATDDTDESQELDQVPTLQPEADLPEPSEFKLDPIIEVTLRTRSDFRIKQLIALMNDSDAFMTGSVVTPKDVVRGALKARAAYERSANYHDLTFGVINKAIDIAIAYVNKDPEVYHTALEELYALYTQKYDTVSLSSRPLLLKDPKSWVYYYAQR